MPKTNMIVGYYDELPEVNANAFIDLAPISTWGVVINAGTKSSAIFLT
jgi:hypothetical protein